MITCPYGAPQFDEDANMIVKCDACKALREDGRNPVCVDACPMRAIEFGDVDELRAAHGDADERAAGAAVGGDHAAEPAAARVARGAAQRLQRGRAVSAPTDPAGESVALEALLLARARLYALFHKLFGAAPDAAAIEALLGEATADAVDLR